MNTSLRLLLFLCILCVAAPINAQSKKSPQQIAAMVDEYRALDRGPYQKIEWFCKDGSRRAARDPCPDNIGGGIQHASYKPAVEDLQKSNHIYLGEILSYTKPWKFWDGYHNHSRIKQYQLQNYLEGVDNGWIQERSQYYRGSVQIEDEEAWGRDFYQNILSSDTITRRDYFLVRESLRDIPHGEETNLSQEIRARSKVLADQIPQFMNQRIKIHSNPEVSDIAATRQWLKDNGDKVNAKQREEFERLDDAMQRFFEPTAISDLTKLVDNWPKDSAIYKATQEFSERYGAETNPEILIPGAAKLMCELRENIDEDPRGSRRMAAMQLSRRLEDLIFKTASQWEPDTIQGLQEKILALSTALAGAGYTELWEWEQVENSLAPSSGTATLGELQDYLTTARRQVEWGTGMVNAVYGDVVSQYSEFEPLAYGFYDDRIRSSLLLPLGETIGELGKRVAIAAGLENQVVDLDNQSTIRGLNPGFAVGNLVVVTGNAEGLDVDEKSIYVFDHPPSDLRPVAGIATVSEGNLVSHVQLLARNLGIPNLALSRENLDDLQAYNGKSVFLAVSPAGNVIMKLASDMSDRERDLVSTQSRENRKVSIPTNKIKLEKREILNMRDVTSKDSGILAGPKAANLGQLKQLFPEYVVEGLVIPFGIFKDHMEQAMPDQGGVSYWGFLNNAFAKAEQMEANGSSPEDVRRYTLSQFDILREKIATMPFTPQFSQSLERQFETILGGRLGSVPVFLRSDTNMEDLPQFTGAGLNLTVFNVVDKDKIMQGIRDVWASPYTARSYGWRHAYLSNPENVYPSILVIPSVDVDYSGVLITKDFLNDDPSKITLAMSRGAGGAVDGQSAETYVISEDGSKVLLSPAREPRARSLPVTGGSIMNDSSFEYPILNKKNLQDVWDISRLVHETMPESKSGEYTGAWDIELGFKDNKLFLFQIRPFVENDNARGSEYLRSITPKIDRNKRVVTN